MLHAGQLNWDELAGNAMAFGGWLVLKQTGKLHCMPFVLQAGTIRERERAVGEGLSVGYSIGQQRKWDVIICGLRGHLLSQSWLPAGTRRSPNLTYSNCLKLDCPNSGTNIPTQSSTVECRFQPPKQTHPTHFLVA